MKISELKVGMGVMCSNLGRGVVAEVQPYSPSPGVSIEWLKEGTYWRMGTEWYDLHPDPDGPYAERDEYECTNVGICTAAGVTALPVCPRCRGKIQRWYDLPTGDTLSPVINQKYARVFTMQPPPGFTLEMRKQAQAEFNAAMLAEQKRRQPKKKKNFDDLDDEFINDLRASIHVKYDIVRLQKERDDFIEWRKKELERLAPDVIPIPEYGVMHKVKVCSTYAYSSQGYGASTYAEGTLRPLQKKLKSLGFLAKNVFSRSKQKYGHEEWQLWANCPGCAHVDASCHER